MIITLCFSSDVEISLTFFFFKVFNVASSCVRVEIDSTMEVYNSGQTFMTPCGKKLKYNEYDRSRGLLVNCLISSCLFTRATLQHSQHVPGAGYFVVSQDVTEPHIKLTRKKRQCRKSLPLVQTFMDMK